MKRYRLALLGTAWLAYMAFTIVGYPLIGIPVMLPSILLCGLATWLYNYKIGLLTSALSHPYNMLVMMYNLGSPQGWHVALEPGGLAAQLLAIFFITVAKSNNDKILELTVTLEKHIQQRNKELQDITEYLLTQSEAERSRMSDQLCDTVAYQLKELLFHSESLRNALACAGAPQATDADKLVDIATQSMEQVKNLTRKLSQKKLIGDEIEHALRKMCAYFTETANTSFTISISDHLGQIPQATSLNIYRIAHEAVTNALRHGKATHVDLALTLAEESCKLEVINDGNPMPTIPNEGLGLRLIQQRADIINATTTFETTDDGRTRFVCISPIL